MKVTAISGSARKDSTNSALLRAIQCSAQAGLEIEIYAATDQLPIFNPDLEGDRTPESVLDFCKVVEASDGLVISSPEYVRSMPGGLKNAIDWLVSRQEMITKPVVLAHASHRGDDMLASLRIVLATVTENFSEEIFLCIPLPSTTPVTVQEIRSNPENVLQIERFLSVLQAFIAEARTSG